MSVQSQHLDMADMLAEINGAAIDDQVRAHLAACADCQADVSSWAAVADGVRHLAGGIRVPTGASPEPVPAGRLRRFRPGRRELIAVAAAAAVVAALLVVLVPGHSRLTRPLHTAWAPARPLPQEAITRAGASSGGWRLASYLVSGGWQQDTAGPEPGYLTCPSARTCYVEGDNATSASGPGDMDSFYVSYNQGLSWSVLPVPSGLTFTSALSCGSVAGCAAGGLYRGQPVLVLTADGGHSWTVAPLPAAAAGLISQLSCPTATTCNGLLTTSSSQLPPAPQRDSGVTFLRTTDGGRHFVTSAFGTREAMQALSCPTVSDCVVSGVSIADRSANAIAYGSIVAVSTDAGASWTQGRLPSGLGGASSPQVACPDAEHCFMLATTNLRTGSEGVAMSADGGRTWTERPLPADIPQPLLSEISCPTDSTCYVSGTEAIAQRFPGGSESGGSAMVLVTGDAGRNWNRIRFPALGHLPPGMNYGAFEVIGDIQCPEVSACVALGVSDQGSRSTPVYTDSTTP